MAKKKKKTPKYDPAWAEAKKRCRLNMQDIKMAQELGLSPRALIKNIPGSNQQWKAPVKDWIRELYTKRKQQSDRDRARQQAANQQQQNATESPSSMDEAPTRE
jgi:hypothetical protein